MSKLYNLVSWLLPVRDFLYILQLEEYSVPRYLKQIPSRLFKRGFEKRGQLDFTQRLKLIFVFTVGLIICSLTLFISRAWMYVILLLLFLPIATPYFIALASLIVQPLANILTQRKCRQASLYFKNNYPDTKVIAVTGSYGKTTTKYLLQAFLEHTYATAIIPENLNTTLGIANYILRGRVPKNCEYLIVEMGAYLPGDIYTCTQILPPDTSIITKLGDQHLERFGSFANLVKAKYEIFSETKANGQCYTTKTAVNILEQHKVTNSQIISISDTQSPEDNILLAKKIAQDLGITKNFINDAAEKFTMPERRDRIYTSQGVTIIDNSYNISPQTAVAVIEKATAKAVELNKQLVIMTAGIAEQGDKSKEINTDFAYLLNKSASRIILHPSVYAQTIAANLTIPFSYETFALTVLDKIDDFVDSETEILLHLPEHGDLAYL